MSMNGWRVLQGFSVHSDDVFAYLDNLTRWDQVFKDTLYVTQELLGGAAAVRIAAVLMVTFILMSTPRSRYIVASSSGIAAGGSSRSPSCSLSVVPVSNSVQ